MKWLFFFVIYFDEKDGKKDMFNGADANLFERAKKLRKQQTAAEEVLWMYLKQKPLYFKFRRQHPFGIYILDFYCHRLKLGIEVDGSVHEDDAVKQHDQQREQTLTLLGIQILRFTNNQIMTNLPEVQQSIETKLSSLSQSQKIAATSS